MRLTLVIPTLGCGGAERVLTTLAGGWADRGDDVTLITLDDEPSYFPLPPPVKRVALGLLASSRSVWSAARNNIARVTRLRRAIKASNPDVVVSFLTTTNVLSILATPRSVPVVVSERTDPRRPRRRFWGWLRSKTYSRAGGVVVQTERALAAFPSSIRRHGYVIANPLSVACDGNGEASSREIVAIGRFSHEKGFDLLLSAFGSIAARHPDWSLTIWGDGPLRGELENQRAALDLCDRVRLPGRTPHVGAKLRAADVFVLSSRYEGFPNALCEAMASGCAVVAADCPSGPREIVRDGHDGILVAPEDSDAMAQAIESLLSDAGWRRTLSARAPEVTVRLGLDRVLDDWDRVFEGVRRV